ncbi:MAG: ABC transporter permease [Acidobacteria bacterium]|nr:ABC transporter permease [Acidobacteriota bacterium]
MTDTLQPDGGPAPGLQSGTASGSGAQAPLEDAAASRLQLVWRRFLRQRLAIAGLVVVALLFGVAYLSPYLGRWQYDQLDFTAFLEPPSASHWFGTTQNGFDVFALTMRGLQKSLVIGLLGALMATALAATVGAFAGYFGGAVNTALVTLIDLLMVLPAFLIIAILSPSFRGHTWLIFVVLLAAFQWMVTARIVRGMTLSLREREFVHAARFMGVPGWRIIFRHILPNMASLLIIDATINVSSLILAEVGLSFFGFGVQPPDVSLGTLIGDYANAALTFPWEFYFPAAFLVILVLAINLVGDGLRDAFDPNAQGHH